MGPKKIALHARVLLRTTGLNCPTNPGDPKVLKRPLSHRGRVSAFSSEYAV